MSCGINYFPEVSNVSCMPLDSEKPCAFSIIPKEITQEIFSFLNMLAIFQVRATCRSFRWIVDSSSSLVCQQENLTNESFNATDLLAMYTLENELRKYLSKSKREESFEELKGNIEIKFDVKLGDLNSNFKLPSNKLILAINKESGFALKLLLKLKDWQKDPLFTESEMNHAFLKAVDGENLELIRIMLQEGKVSPFFKGLALQVGIEKKDLQLVKDILADSSIDFSIFEFDTTPLLSRVVKANDVEIFQAFCADERLYSSSWNNYALELTSLPEYFNLLETLYTGEKKFSSKFEYKALKRAIKHDYVKIFKFLIDHQKLNIREYEELIRVASINLRSEMLRDLLNRTELDLSPFLSDTFLDIIKLKNMNIDIIKIFLGHPSVKPSAKNDQALSYAIRQENLELVKALLKHPDVHPSACGNGVLQLISLTGDIEFLKELIQDPRLIRYGIGYNKAIKIAKEKARKQTSAKNNYSEIASLLEKTEKGKSNKVKGQLYHLI